MPLRLPVVGGGLQPFNPIHAADLADVIVALITTPKPVTWEIGCPEMPTQADIARSYRRWLGLRPVPLWSVPAAAAMMAGRIGDALRAGPISTTALRQLDHGVLADPAPLLTGIAYRPRGFSSILASRPAGTQDLWHARLYLVKPLIRIVLAVMWLVSASLGFFTPVEHFAALLGLPEPVALLLARGGGLVDLALGVALLRNWRPFFVAQAQLGVVLAYTLGLTLLSPTRWLDPFGGLLKNLPVIALLLVHLAIVEER
jgi:hypothetical protein